MNKELKEIRKELKNPSYCQKCGVFGEHHSYMLKEEWRGLCNDCAFQEHWKDVGTMCDEFTKKSGKLKNENPNPQTDPSGQPRG